MQTYKSVENALLSLLSQDSFEIDINIDTYHTTCSISE